MSLPERFEIVTLHAGNGGFGKVDKAMDKELERFVAIKTLDPLFKDIDVNDIDRFKKEAKTLARLSHPNIPAVYDVRFNPSEKDFKILYEWIEGTSLNKYLQDVGVVSLEKVKLWFGNICSALQHAHEYGIIHRDLKPGNIIITQNEDACYLVDFGIALLVKDILKIKGDSKLGTPGYMSPEQEKGGEIDGASDVFVLGILLYECLCGTKPAIGEYKPLNSFNEAIPPAVDELIKSCFAEKARRIKTPAEFYQRLISATRPHSNLTHILSQGALHEMFTALSEMDESSFEEVPGGQRMLILTRAKTLINQDEHRLRNPAAALLSELIRVGAKLPDKDYIFLAANGFKYGFDLEYSGSWIGNPAIREALAKVALNCSASTHKVITKSILDFYNKEKLAGKQRWYVHDLRVIAQNLMSNVSCGLEDGEKLAIIFEDTINAAHA
jgi:serine/threonine-protein kinase